jgi:hypothetical protein
MALRIEHGRPWEHGYVEPFNGKMTDELPNGKGLDRIPEAIGDDQFEHHGIRCQIVHRHQRCGIIPACQWQQINYLCIGTTTGDS